MTSVVQLGELITPAAVVRAGKRELPVLSMTMREGLIDQSQKFKKRVASRDLSQYRVVLRGQLVVGFPIDEGLLSFQQCHDSAVVSPAYAIWDIRQDSPDVHRPYLERFLRSPRALNFYVSKLRGSTARRRSLPREVFLAMEVPLPALDQQRRISDLLDQADALRGKRRAAIEKLETLKQSIFLEMFGDPYKNPLDWPRVSIGDLITLGPQNGLYKKSDAYGSGTRIVRIDSYHAGALVDEEALKRVRITEAERRVYELRPDDIVINRVNSGEFVGKSLLVPRLSEPTIFESNMMRLRVDLSHVHPYFLAQSLRTRFLAMQIKKATKDAVNQSSINQQDVKSFIINLPPLADQQRFVSVTSRLDCMTPRCAKSLSAIEDVITSLQLRAFAGML